VYPAPPPSRTQPIYARRVLVVAPHHDDEVLGCGGLLGQLAASGARIDVVFLTDSAGAPGDPDGGPAYARRRLDESRGAARVLGIADRLDLGLPDGELAQAVHLARAGRAIADRMRADMPDLLLAPSPLELSSDHRAASVAVHDAIQHLRTTHEDAIRRLDVLFYGINRGAFPDRLVDVSAQVDLIERAMACYTSQQARHDYLGAALGLRRFRTLTLPAGITHAEGYRHLSGWDFATRSASQILALVGGAADTPPLAAATADAWTSNTASSDTASSDVGASGPLVSVIVRTRDRPHLLGEALASVARSTYRRIELVLINDGGAPPAVPEAYPFPVVRVDHEHPRGRAAAAQAGIDAASGAYVAFLDDDDVFAPEHVSTLIGVVRATGARVAYTDAAVTVYALDPEHGWTCVERALPYGGDFDAERLLVDNYIPLNTLLVDASLFAAAGPFDTSFDIFEDWDMLIRLSALAPFQHVARVTCEYRHYRGVRGQALGETGSQHPDFIDTKARVLARHAARLDPHTLARAIVSLRAEESAAEQQRRQAVLALDAVNAELRRVYAEEARLTAATHDLAARLTASPAPAAAAPLESVASAPRAPTPAPAPRHGHPIRTASVLLLSWDGREHLETCLDAIARVHAPGVPLDCWVLDNGSRDGTVDWLRTRHPDVRVVSSPVNLGFCAGYNRLVSAVESDLLLFLNNDTEPSREWAGELIDAIAGAPPDVAAAAGLITDWSGERLDFGRGVMTFDGHAFQLDSGRPLDAVRLPARGEPQLFACGGNMIVRREAFLDAGGFDEQYFAYYDDVDFGWRVWSGGERVVSAPGGVVRHRSASTSDRLGIYNRGFLFERNAFLTAFKNFDAPLWDKLMPAVLLTLISRTTALVRENNPEAAALSIDPFAPGTATAAASDIPEGIADLANSVAAAAGGRRWWSRRETRSSASSRSTSPVLSDERTIAQFRTLHWITRHMDAAAERRRQVQARRRRSDAEIFEAFPLHLVPTYPGDEALFHSPGFQAWLPESPKLVFRTLAEISART